MATVLALTLHVNKAEISPDSSALSKPTAKAAKTQICVSSCFPLVLAVLIPVLFCDRQN